MENPWHYRNKNLASCGLDEKNKFTTGFYQENTHKLIEIEDYLIQDEEANRIIAYIKKLGIKYKLRPYDEDRNQGYLRHILIRKGYYSKEVFVTLVVASFVFKGQSSFVGELIEKFLAVKSVVLNINNKRTGGALGSQEKIIYGRGYVEDKLLDMVFQISSGSFYQINSLQIEKLYTKALEYADLKEKETIIDAYCGTGTIGLLASREDKRVLGVEVNKKAINDGIKNARRNRVDNISFINEGAGSFMVKAAVKRERIDVVFC